MQHPPHFLPEFRDIDGMLTGIDEMITASRSHSPFNDYLTQLSAEQQKIVTRGISELRAAMVCILRQHGIVANDPTINTAWAIRKTLLAAASRLDELMDWRATIGAGELASDEKSIKLLMQMRNAFNHLNRCLSVSETALASMEQVASGKNTNVAIAASMQINPE